MAAIAAVFFLHTYDSRYANKVNFKNLLIEIDGSLLILAALIGFPLLVWGPSALSYVVTTPAPPVTVVFLGDIMLDRQIRLDAEVNGYDFLVRSAKPLWMYADAVVGNLEGPITNASSTSVGSIVGSPENYSFTFAPETADFLARSGIKYVSLANNHSLNQGFDGLAETKKYLSREHVEYFGPPGDEAHRVAYFERGNVKIAFVAYNEFWKNDAAPAVLAVKEARKHADFVVIFAHWGNEYEKTPREDVRELAHLFVEAGANLVVGAHPHVIVENEEYQGVPIYYSLGNFIFDQYWNTDVRCGLVLTATFRPFTPVQVSSQNVELMPGGETVPAKCNS